MLTVYHALGRNPARNDVRVYLVRIQSGLTDTVGIRFVNNFWIYVKQRVGTTQGGNSFGNHANAIISHAFIH